MVAMLVKMLQIEIRVGYDADGAGIIYACSTWNMMALIFRQVSSPAIVETDSVCGTGLGLCIATICNPGPPHDWHFFRKRF